MIYDIGIVAGAVGLEKEANNFVESIKEHKTKCSYFISITTKKNYFEYDPITYSQAKAKNIGIRNCLNNCKTIVCFDIDSIIPPKLIDFLAFETQDQHIWVKKRHITEKESLNREWGKWTNIKPTISSGSCNSLSAKNWLNIGGWDERCYGWSPEDYILHTRIKQNNIKTIAIETFPLMHIDHKIREYNSKGNRYKQGLQYLHIPQLNYLKPPFQNTL